ncbi:MAG: GNAT family N-acetyltransferase [Cyclobacteriaceae bacterium]
MKYLFKSSRLGFRNWEEKDLLPMTALNQDKEVMKYFPDVQNEQQTRKLVTSMQQHFEANGFCYFAVDTLEDEEFIGFIGLMTKVYLEELGELVDIGWRLRKGAWGNGYATEGAMACLKYGFENLGLDKIYAVCPAVNLKSEAVMKKIGMKKLQHFEYSKLKNDARLRECLLYQIQKS